MIYLGNGMYSDAGCYLQHHGVKGMKWGVRNGPPYPVNSDRLSRNIFNEAKKREPSITKDVLDSAANANSNMYGLEHKLKTLDSIKRKIETDSEEKSISISNAAKDIKDAVRYTTISDDDVFVLNYKTFKSKMEDKGYKEVRCKNYFDLYNQGKVKHKSVQSIFETPDGYKFEVQFQTPSSQKAKDKKVKIYEERRKPNISKEKQIELENKMVKLAERVKDPKDISDILTHSELYLCHHGIKGQKWGVKHGPPYPLNSKTNRMIRRSRNNADYASRYQDYHDTSKTS